MARPPLAARRRLVAGIVLLALAPATTTAASFIAPAKWGDLPADKQRILAPLSSEWASLESWRRKKWLEIADRYPRMAPQEQERVQQRMQTWVLVDATANDVLAFIYVDARIRLVVESWFSTSEIISVAPSHWSAALKTRWPGAIPSVVYPARFAPCSLLCR